MIAPPKEIGNILKMKSSRNSLLSFGIFFISPKVFQLTKLAEV